jgi:hypothetical protein
MLDFPPTKVGDSALRAVTKEAVGIHILVKRSLFGDGILRRFPRHAFEAKSPFAPLRF